MISDLIEFGKWLDENNQDVFGKNVKDYDYTMGIHFDTNSKKIGFEKITQIKNNILPYFEDSIFNDQLYITTDQKLMIPSKSNLLGLTPFFLKIDHDFTTRGNLEDKDKIEKFYNKIDRSKKSNDKGGEFIAAIKKIYDDIEGYLGNIGIGDREKDILTSFFEEYSFEDIEKILVEYYNWLYNNRTQIVELINEFKADENYDKKLNGNFYLACYSNSELDILNDIFYYHSKFIKNRNENFEEDKDGNCIICGKKGVVYPAIGSYSLGNPSYSFNYDESEKTAIKYSKLRLCKKCTTYSMLGEDNLKKILLSHILIIPKNIKGNFEDFMKISNKEINSFRKLNEFLTKNSGFNYDLAIYTLEQGDRYLIKKYIENYRAYLVKFGKADMRDEEKIYLYKDDVLNYLFNEKFKKGEKEKSKIENLFDMENIFKQFFIDINGNTVNYPKIYHFYQIYTKDLIGKSGILCNFDSKAVSIFTKYMHNIFNLIYELNEDALTKNMLNEIVLNCLIKIQKHNKADEKHQGGIFYFDVIKRLNYYYMIKEELLGDNMLKKDGVNKLKEIFAEYNKDNKDTVKSISEADRTQIEELIENDPSIKYYLLGKFIKLIEGWKSLGGKKAEVFNNYVTNANRNNIRNLFVTEVLKKNNYYIEQMGKKGKFVFNLIEEDLGELFNEKGLSFEDYILLLFTGYYTENILASTYGAKKENGGVKE
jgi:CRISPR-associated protein Csh1